MQTSSWASLGRKLKYALFVKWKTNTQAQYQQAPCSPSKVTQAQLTVWLWRKTHGVVLCMSILFPILLCVCPGSLHGKWAEHCSVWESSSSQYSACRGGSHCSLMFCTNGVLLRQLTHGNELQDITHIIIDEIHERDSFSDFLLILLRDVLPSHPALRLVLMSATLHVDLFASYFNHCPVVQVSSPSSSLTGQMPILEDKASEAQFFCHPSKQWATTFLCSGEQLGLRLLECIVGPSSRTYIKMYCLKSTSNSR